MPPMTIGTLAVGLARALRVDDHRAVGALAAVAAGRVGVVAAHPPVGGVAIDHRIHVAGGDAEEQARRAERAEGLGTVPVGLRDDADAQPLRLEHAADDRHAETRMIDVGIAGHDDDVALLPAERVHLRARHRQERRRPAVRTAAVRSGTERGQRDADRGRRAWSRIIDGCDGNTARRRPGQLDRHGIKSRRS